MYVCVNVTCYIVLIFRTFVILDNKITAVTNNVLFQNQRKETFVTDIEVSLQLVLMNMVINQNYPYYIWHCSSIKYIIERDHSIFLKYLQI